MKEIIADLLGTLTITNLVVAYIFAFAGLFLKWYFTSSTAAKHNPDSPAKFSLVYWITHNLKNKMSAFLATLIIIFISLRYADELLGQNFSYLYALGVGLGFDWIADLWKKKTQKP